MDTVNLKDILTGKSNKLPDNLTIDDRYTFVKDFATALHRMESDWHGDKGTIAEWDEITDCYLQFLMDNFSIEMQIASAIQAWRVHHISFNAETDTFTKFYKVISPWLLSDSDDFKVYNGDGKYVDHETYEKNKTPSKETYGGNFTLRDHNK